MKVPTSNLNMHNPNGFFMVKYETINKIYKFVRSEDQVMREFAINLLIYFSGADSGVARTIALQELKHSTLNK